MMRTCTTMICTDGSTTKYAVMQGPARGKVFYSGKAEIVAVYTLFKEQPDYHAMTAKHATLEAPAVSWQA